MAHSGLATCNSSRHGLCGAQNGSLDTHNKVGSRLTVQPIMRFNACEVMSTQFGSLRLPACVVLLSDFMLCLIRSILFARNSAPDMPKGGVNKAASIASRTARQIGVDGSSRKRAQRTFRREHGLPLGDGAAKGEIRCSCLSKEVQGAARGANEQMRDQLACILPDSK